MDILLIEPDKLLADSYQEALTANGHSVTSVNDAQMAVHQLDQQVPDLIVLEVQMLNHNGVEFLYELRSYPEWQHLPVVIQSFVPRAELPSPERLRDLGVVDYLYKPTSSLRRLTNLIARHHPVTV